MPVMLANLQLPAYPTLSESLRFQFTGFLVVMTVLASLWLLISLMGIGFRKSASRAAALAKIPAAAATPTPPAISPVTIAVITAAVHVTCGPQFRIADIAESPHPSEVNLQAWSIEGRRTIFSSHQVR